MSDDVTIGKHVRYFREKSGMTQERLAEEVGVSSETISKIERGQRRFSLFVCCMLSDALDCTPNDLLGYSQSHNLLYEDLQQLLLKYKN